MENQYLNEVCQMLQRNEVVIKEVESPVVFMGDSFITKVYNYKGIITECLGRKVVVPSLLMIDKNTYVPTKEEQKIIKILEHSLKINIYRKGKTSWIRKCISFIRELGN